MALDVTKFVLPDGAPAGGFQPLLSAPIGPADVALVGVPVNVVQVLAVESNINQVPPGENSPIQITFGGPAGGGGDPVQMLADGTLQINDPGSYFISHAFTLGRSGTSGTAQVDMRQLDNAVQVGPTAVFQMDTTDETTLFTYTTLTEYAGGATITHEIVRDTEGSNEGGLSALPVSQGGWLPSASARLVVWQVENG